MNHKNVQLLVDGYISGELDLVNAVEIEEHLQNCPICSQYYKEHKALHSAIENASLFTPAPKGLEKRIRISIRKESNVPQFSFIFQWRWLAASLAFILILIFGAALLGGVFNQNQETALAEEVQSAAVRSLMANHLTDVTSTSQHTVKPWFAGKLDFSPPVDDLAAKGYPLIGGRLDYLQGHPVAALIYQSDAHYINLFIWPAADKINPSGAFSYNGYNLIHWNQSEMTFWAVSDLNMTELQNFAQLFQKNAG
jgi:anti-sigma factor RsiW